MPPTAYLRRTWTASEASFHRKAGDFFFFFLFLFPSVLYRAPAEVSFDGPILSVSSCCNLRYVDDRTCWTLQSFGTIFYGLTYKVTLPLTRSCLAAALGKILSAIATPTSRTYFVWDGPSVNAVSKVFSSSEWILISSSSFLRISIFIEGGRCPVAFDLFAPCFPTNKCG